MGMRDVKLLLRNWNLDFWNLGLFIWIISCRGFVSGVGRGYVDDF